MKIDKTKSILNQKCECGRPIDYYALRKHFLTENEKLNNKFFKFLIILHIVYTLSILIIHKY